MSMHRACVGRDGTGSCGLRVQCGLVRLKIGRAFQIRDPHSRGSLHAGVPFIPAATWSRRAPLRCSASALPSHRSAW